MVVNAEIVTGRQYAEMILIYDKYQRNATAATKIYSEPFSCDRHLMHESTTDALTRLREIDPGKVNIRVSLKEELTFSLLNLELSPVEISETGSYTRQHVKLLLHARGTVLYNGEF